jgi:hypothetical protein
MTSIVRDWRLELIEAHLNLFHRPAGAPEATQGYPICGDGWRDLLERLCTRIEAALADGAGSLRVLQIKEKYGTLRFYWRGELSDDSRMKIEEAIALPRPGLPAPARNAAKKAACTDMAGSG